MATNTRSSTPHPALCIQLNRQSVTIRHHDPLICEVLTHHLRHCLRASHSPSGDATVYLRDDPVFNAESNLIDLMNEAIFHLIAPCDDALLFHTAGVARNDRGILLCGASGSGKSTLTAWLLQRGYAYMSDELIAVPRQNTETVAVPYQMYGLARSLVLKTDSAFVWSKLPDNSAPVYRFADGGAWVSPEWFSATIQRQSVPQFVIFPRYQPHTSFQVKPLSSGEATFALLQNLVNARNMPKRGLTEVSRLAQSVIAFQVTYSSLAQVSDWMEHHL